MKKILAFNSVALLLVMGLIMSIFTPTTAQSKTEIINWKMATAWPAGSGLQENVDHWVEKVNKLAKGRLKIKVFTAGELFGAIEALPAASDGKIDLAGSTIWYAMGELPAATVALGARIMVLTDPHEIQAWLFGGGGLELLNEYVQTRYNLKCIGGVFIESEVCWFTKPVSTLKDLKGKKIRAVGINMEFWKKLGVETVMLPGSEIMPALQRKVIDGADWTLPYTDYPAGIHKVAPYGMIGAVHQPCAWISPVQINLDSWNKLPEDLKELLTIIGRETMHWTANERVVDNIGFWEKMKIEGAQFTRPSEDLRKEFIRVEKDLREEYRNKYPWAKKFLESQEKFHKRYLTYWHQLYPYYENPELK